MHIEKSDLTEYSHHELSLLVFKTEYLYKQRRNIKQLTQTLNELYTYNDNQYFTLLQDIKKDLGEA